MAVDGFLLKNGQEVNKGGFSLAQGEKDKKNLTWLSVYERRLVAPCRSVRINTDAPEENWVSPVSLFCFYSSVQSSPLEGTFHMILIAWVMLEESG